MNCSSIRRSGAAAVVDSASDDDDSDGDYDDGDFDDESEEEESEEEESEEEESEEEERRSSRQSQRSTPSPWSFDKARSVQGQTSERLLG